METSRSEHREVASFLESHIMPANLSGVDINALIIVCGHAVWQGGHNPHVECQFPLELSYEPGCVYPPLCIHDNVHDEGQWIMKDFQKGETGTFVKHVRQGLMLLEQSLTASMPAHATLLKAPEVQATWDVDKSQPHGPPFNPLLCFSGGATDARTTLSEGQSYTRVADYLLKQDVAEGLLTPETAIKMRNRMYVEGWATDSMQNILLSLIQFGRWKAHFTHRVDGPWRLQLPKYLIIISHDFKRARFMDIHLPTIQRLWPLEGPDRINPFGPFQIRSFVGINPPTDDAKLRELIEGEQVSGYGAWENDVFGTGDSVKEKRRARGWHEGRYKQFIEAGLTHAIDQNCVRSMIKGQFGLNPWPQVRPQPDEHVGRTEDAEDD